MRETCLYCVTKHLAQATVLLLEVPQKYPEHIHLAAGHLGEAADECITQYPELARKIRTVRLVIMGQDQETILEEDFMMALIAEARAEAEKINGIPEEERIANIFKNQIKSNRPNT